MTPRRLTALGALVERLTDGLSSPPTEEGRAAVEELLPEGEEFAPYLSRFTALIVLSSGIAAFGLLADSSAVVIGAMLVAPLMTPITAAAEATVTARNARLLRSVLVILLGMAGAVLVGYATAALAGLHPTAATDLPDEILARTYPGLLDLGIAITAGAAAGYIAPRRATVGALPGVGIAVALVPPLATVGICLEVGQERLAANALLLFLTNLAAIIFAAALLLIVAGFRPSTGGGRGSLARRLTVTLTLVAVIAVPLTLHTRETIAEASLERSVADAVVEWDPSARVVELTSDDTAGLATVELLASGPNAPKPAWQLAEGIQSRYAGHVDLRLLYQRDALFEVSVR